MLGQTPLQGLSQLRDLFPQTLLGQFGQFGWIAFPRHQGLQHRLSRFPHDVRGHRSQLDVGVLKRLVDPVDDPRLFARQLRPLSRQLTQLSLRAGWNEAAAQQSTLQQMCDPLRIGHIGFAAGDFFDMARIDQQQFEPSVQNVPDGFPQHTGRFHGHVRNTLFRQPIRHLEQFPGHGAERPDLLHDATLRLDSAHARHDRLLVDIQPRNTLVNRVHGNLPRKKSLPQGTSNVKTFCSACSPTSGATIEGTAGCPGQTALRARRTNEKSACVLTATSPITLLEKMPIFIIQGADFRHGRLPS